VKRADRQDEIYRSNIPFLDIKKEDIERSAQINIVAATAFSQAATRCFIAEFVSSLSLSSIPPSFLARTHAVVDRGREGEKGGSIIMTAATSAWRGKEAFGAFAAGKHGLRAISQSIAREFGPQGVHVAFVVSSTLVSRALISLTHSASL